MTDVVRQEGPIQHELLFSRIRAAAGYGRAGRNIRIWLENMIIAAVRDGHFKATDGTYLMDGTSCDMPRDWSARPDAERKSDYLPNVEIAAALRHVIKSSFGIHSDEAVREAFRLIGFRRITDDALNRGRSVLDTMMQTGEVIQQEGSVRPA
jgi:hypothetical protein